MTEYNELLKKIGFEEKAIITVNNKNVHVCVGRLNLRDVIIKIVPKIEIAKVQGFYKEAIVDDILEQNNKDLSKPLILKARVLAVGQNEEHAWIIRRYYPGRALSIDKDEKKLFVDRLSTIERKYLFKKDIIRQVVQNIKSLRSLSTNMRKSGIRRDTFQRRFGDSLEYINVKKIEDSLDVDLSAKIVFYEKYCKNYFDKKNIVACTGDLTPANIILKKDGQVIFSDFEWFCLDNNTIDVAFLWLFLYKYQGWQKYLIKTFVVSEEDKINFQVSLIRILLYWFDKAFKNDHPSIKSLDNRKRYKKHIWVKYLKLTGESFEALMKAR